MQMDFLILFDVIVNQDYDILVIVKKSHLSNDPSGLSIVRERNGLSFITGYVPKEITVIKVIPGSSDSSMTKNDNHKPLKRKIRLKRI